MRKLSVFTALCISALAVAITSCTEEGKTVKDSVSIVDNVTEVVFTPDDTEPKTLTVKSNTDWSLAIVDEWVSVSPSEGKSGDTAVTVSLNEETTDTDRNTTVTITAGTAEVSFTVIQKAPVEASAINLSGAQKRIMIGQSLPLEVTVEPEGASMGTVTYSSSDDAVATVSEDGTVTAVTVGNATITATMGTLTAEYPVEVTEKFTTDGTGIRYTFGHLAGLPALVVTGSDGQYTVTSDIIVDANDTLSIEGTSEILVNDGVIITVMGELDFDAQEKASIGPSDSEAEPGYLYLTEDAGGIISNMVFTRMPIRSYGERPVTISDCEMTGITQGYAAINLGSSALTTVTGCRFIDNAYPAIAGGANIASPLIFRDNYLEGNSNDCRNRPHINVTAGGDGDIEIVRNTIIGPGEITMNGGIAVANMLGIGGTNNVLIEGNKVSDCRYGITTNGPMNVRIIDNELVDNKWDSNPMTGGSGVSIYNSAGGQKVYMSGNLIKGHLWGITNIGNVAEGTGPELNLGNLTEGDDYNPGENIFEDNGNNGVLYDLYNNCPLTVYAQGNTWNVAVQDRENIETVIFHKNDDETLGEVIFM